MESKDITIVGMSCFAPGAHDIHEFWDNLVNGVDSITDVPAGRIDPIYFEDDNYSVDRFYCKRGGFIPDITFDPLPYSILPVALEGMDTIHMLALKLVYEALKDAAVFEKKIPLNKSALIIGKGNYVGSAIWRAIDIVHVGEQIAEVVKTSFPGMTPEEITKIKKEYQKSRGRYEADSMPGLIPNLIASLVANKLDMQGPAYTIDAACASSLIALDSAIKEIHSGRCDIAIAGGIHAGQNATFWSIFSQLGALSHKQKITPFSEDADGLLIGEGGGFVVLKTLEKALANNDRIYAVIKGTGVSSDGSGVSVMAPAVKGQKLAIEEAWRNANMDPDKIGYIEAHGTATIVGDKTELNSLSSVFPNKEGTNKVLIGSVKSNIGHAMPAAGILGLIKTTLSLYNRQIPPTLHCENPLKEMKSTRFRPVHKLEEWNENKYPLVAGVNAFGFGGINAHVILEAYGEKKEAKITSLFPNADEVLVLSAPTKEALINALKSKENLHDKQGDYRLVLFNPTSDRIEKTIKLIEKDVVWKGRQDIWYTNEPLLKSGRKVAFLYPGFEFITNPETDSLSDYFGISVPQETVENNDILNQCLKLYQNSEIMNQSLERLGIKSDINLGHSLGEWFGIRASGMVSAETVKSMVKSIDPSQYTVDGIYFVATGCGKEKLKPIMEKLPNVYLSNDNCPNQVLLSVKEKDLQPLVQALQNEQIFYQQLSYQSGFHSPFISDKLHLLEEAFEELRFEGQKTPMWSASTLEIYPSNLQDIKKLCIKHLLETVHFNGLIKKLYDEENVRVFIQVGSGSLIGFIDDILLRKKYGAVSLTSNHRSTLEQLRRVLALLYIEGKNVNPEFLIAQAKSTTDAVKKNLGKEVKLQMGMDIVKDFPLLSNLSKNYGMLKSCDISSLSLDTDHPVLKALNENMKEMTLMQNNISKLLRSRPRLVTTNLNQVPVAPTIVNEKKTGQVFEEDLYISLETHPSLIGHSLVKQPSHWTEIGDINPVIPMTMTVELMGEAAQKQDPLKKITQIGPISVFQWMEVHNPFVQKISGAWKAENSVSLEIKGFASAEVKLNSTFSKPEPFYEEEIDLGKSVRKFPTKSEIYDKYMFHGIEYQGIERVADVTKKGIRTYLHRCEGKGSLLDNVGQTYGLYLHLMLDKNFISFPVKIQEINFYQDMHDQEGEFECICLSKEIGDVFTSCDIVLKRDGKLWCIIKGWQNRRFEFDDAIWQMTLKPRRNLLAEEIAPNIYYYYDAYEKPYSWNFLYKRYLNQPEKRHYNSLPLNKRKDYLISRIALKDSLRSYIQRQLDKETYPIEYFIRYDEQRKPSVYGIDEVENLEISIAHKGTNAVCIVSKKPVGIDIEVIEERTEGFVELTFTDHERDLLKGKNQAEWTTRFWVAKEAYGKMLGLGLQGNPKQYEVKKIIDDEYLVIEDSEVKTMKYKKFIIGWTK